MLFRLEPYEDQTVEKIITKPMPWMIENINWHCVFLLICLWENEKVKKTALAFH